MVIYTPTDAIIKKNTVIRKKFGLTFMSDMILVAKRFKKKIRYIAANIRFTRKKKSQYILIRDTPCIQGIKLSKMFIKMTAKNVGNRKYDATEFVVFQMFVLE